MNGFDVNELLVKFRYPLLILLLGLILTAFGALYFKNGLNIASTKVEVLLGTTEGLTNGAITAEIAGEVLVPGVCGLPSGSRVNDLLVKAGGFSANADKTWTDKYLNRVAKLTDGQKVYIPSVNEQST
ncbi:MAG: SLBB domain-containing protein [Candidatus Microgenomates bacterium]|jgi:competence protein ComEA